MSNKVYHVVTLGTRGNGNSFVNGDFTNKKSIKPNVGFSNQMRGFQLTCMIAGRCHAWGNVAINNGGAMRVGWWSNHGSTLL